MSSTAMENGDGPSSALTASRWTTGARWAYRIVISSVVHAPGGTERADRSDVNAKIGVLFRGVG